MWRGELRQSGLVLLHAMCGPAKHLLGPRWLSSMCPARLGHMLGPAMFNPNAWPAHDDKSMCPCLPYVAIRNSTNFSFGNRTSAL